MTGGRLTVADFQSISKKRKIVSLTAYSKSIAKILDNYCDIVLVGDSMANVLYGHKNTHKISLQNIIHQKSFEYLDLRFQGKNQDLPSCTLLLFFDFQ